MDGQPHAEVRRRGGGRGGGLSRKNSGGRTYRRVQASVSDSSAATEDSASTTSSSAAKSSQSSYRSVQVVDAAAVAAAPAPFRSSLKDSLRQNAPPAPTKVEGKKSDRSVHAEKSRPFNRDRSRERPRSARSRSPAPHKRDLQIQASAPRGARQVISLSSPSPQKAPDQPKRFVSSLVQAIDQEDRAPRLQDRENRTSGGRGQPDSSLRRSQSREPRHHTREEHAPPYRHVERGVNNRSSSVSTPKLTRKNSTDSISSQRSDRSERSHRRQRSNGGGDARSGLSGDKTDGSRPLRRLSSGSSGQTPFKSSLSATKSSQDVRVQKSRPSSGTIGRGYAPLARPAQDSTTRRSSLDGGAASLRRLNSNSSSFAPPASRSSAQDVRSSLGAALPDTSRSPSAAVSGGLRKSSPVAGPRPAPSSPIPIKSAVTQEKVAQDMEGKTLKTPPPPIVDEAGRKRLADTLKERMESRKLERGSSLAQMMKAPANRQGSLEDDSRPPEARRSPLTSRKELQNGEISSAAAAEKEARVKEFYAKLDKDNSDGIRGTVPFKSSLTSSITSSSTQTFKSSLATSSAPSQPIREVRPFKSSLATSNAPPQPIREVRTFKSSLTAAIEPSLPIATRIKKLQYSLLELKRLVAFAIPKPSDLPDMKIVEVVQVRDPRSVSKRSSSQFGGGPANGGGRSIGGSIRRNERFGSAGRGPASRQQSGSGGGRRDRQQGGRGGRGGGGGGRGGRGGGGGRGYNNRPPPPPLYDGPIEPLTISENRWKPNKEKETSGLDGMLSHIKSLLNKLTREKFAKLTNELCGIEIDSLILLRSIVAIIMDKALEEANFADVYADLCKEFHKRTFKKTWSFNRVLEDGKGSFFWTAIDETAYKSLAGPFDSAKSCLEDIASPESTASSTCDYAAVSSVRFYRHGDWIVALGEKEKGAFYYTKRKISELSEDEPLDGPFASAELAQQAAATRTNFTRLLVMRCQLEFEKTNKHVGSQPKDKEEEEIDPRKREILAMRAKAKMLGNIRFIGELFKVDLIKQNVVQGCIFYLLGLELIAGEAGQEAQAQAVRFPDEEDLEALCKMLATVGKKLDQPKTKMIMKIIILRMVELSDNDKLPSRARFLIKDLLEMRDHQWEPRRKEMQQKTLDEVRREAQKLQQQGKNAQHDDLTRRRHKTQITSAQLAKQSGNLIVAQKEVVEPEHDDEPSSTELSPTQMTSRIKNIIQEYISILDLDEAATCVQEVPVDPYHVEFAEQTINTALEGKTNEREHAVELLVGLYERGALDANSIQAALVNVMEFLEDMRIDLPLVHQYSALIFGRLVAAGCFGLSWIVSEALAHLVECKLASSVFPEVLTVLEMESDERTVLRMLADEEITPGSVLPASMRNNEADIEAYLRENGIEDFFGNGESSDEEEELDPEVAMKLRNTLEEYLSVKDKSEVVQCVQEFELPERWQHFVHIALLFSLDAKKAVRSDVAELLLQLFVDEQITTEGVEAACEPVLEDYDDLRVDMPQLAINLSELWTPLFEKQFLSPTWLSQACGHLAASGRAADVFNALFSEFETRYGQEALVAWWKTQSEVDVIWTQIEPTDKPQDERLAKWKLLLAQ